MIKPQKHDLAKLLTPILLDRVERQVEFFQPDFWIVQDLWSCVNDTLLSLQHALGPNKLEC